MKYRLLGNSGLKVSLYSMGAMTFGRETSVEDSYTMLDMFVDAGGNFIDTANVYSLGKSEEVVGEWLSKKRRDDFIIATKARFPMGKGVNEVGVSRKHILSSVHASLQRLKTDHIDLLYAHCWDHLTPLEETLATFNSLVQQGKVRYIAASNYSPSQLQRSADLCKARGHEPYIALQAKYNLMVRSPEWELLEVCENNGVGFVVWGPLFGGWLSGRYKRGMTAPPEGRVKEAEKHGWFEKWSRYNTEKTWQILDAVEKVAQRNNATHSQVSLQWLCEQRGIASIILGASKISHLQDNLGSIENSLSDEDCKILNTASAIELPYPYDFLAMGRESR